VGGDRAVKAAHTSISGVAAPPTRFSPVSVDARGRSGAETRGVGASRLAATLAVGAACAALSACGGGDKPAYCSSVNDFKDSVSGLTNLQIAQNGVSAVTTQVNKIKSSGQQLVADAKSDFPSETTALSGSITALAATAQQLGDTQTQKAALLALPGEIQAVKSSYDALSSAVKSKCD
jgi:hypothetical protein